MSKKLINKSAALLEDRGFSQITSAQDRQRKSGGITHTVFEHDESGERFLVRAKEYVYQDKAPFGKGMIDHALADHTRVVIYFDDQERFLVFDPRYIDEHGVQTSGRSKRSEDQRVYIEVDLDAGADLSQYIAGHYQPKHPDDGYGRDPDTTPTGLDDFL